MMVVVRSMSETGSVFTRLVAVVRHGFKKVCVCTRLKAVVMSTG